MTPVLAALLNEWFTGRDATDNESARFAKRWVDSRTPFEKHASAVENNAQGWGV